MSDHLNKIPEDANIANKVLIFAFAGHGNYHHHYDVKLAANQGGDLSLWKEIMPPFVMDHPAHIFKVPKLFFIDACRGRERLTVADENQNTTREGQDTHVDVGNFLIAYSTIKGYVAFDGGVTWMKRLADKIRAGEHNITTILDNLAHATRKDMQPEYISRLQGSYEFPPAPQPGLAALPQATLQPAVEPFIPDAQLPGGDEETNPTNTP